MRILLVEDNIADIIIVQEAFEELGNSYRLDYVKEGAKVMDKVKESFSKTGVPPYALIFLDINIPSPNGREILCELKRNRQYADIPVVILTTSSDSRDIEFAYRYQVNAFVTKPTEIDEFLESIKGIVRFWEKVGGDR
ncbi:MAG: response regulator [Muricauda sp.]|nr:response regulator [Allomuricauda sp.]MBO6532174.1 response regulator [Allomuricauda sp.]MBO6588528.1 response regulator [Allomuricauda sp.]MBO6618332.1 response regulator [Allomuricauda sp.]MBO6644066.1 response regulator [Allomuricauda sp.]MBO6746950.1 response regulator [Allomuricauda sp.]